MFTTAIQSGPSAKIDIATGSEPTAASADEPSFSAVLHRSRTTRTVPKPAARSESAHADTTSGAASSTTTAPQADAAGQASGPRNATPLRGNAHAEPRLSALRPRQAELPIADRATSEAASERRDAVGDDPPTAEGHVDPTQLDWTASLKLPAEPAQAPGSPGSPPHDTPNPTNTGVASHSGANKHQASDLYPHLPAQIEPSVPGFSNTSAVAADPAPASAGLEPVTSRDIAGLELTSVKATTASSDDSEQPAPVRAHINLNGTPVSAAPMLTANGRPVVMDENVASLTALSRPGDNARASSADAPPRVTTRRTADASIALADPTQSRYPSGSKQDYLGLQADASSASRESSLKAVTAGNARDHASDVHAVAANTVQREFGVSEVAQIKLPVPVTSPEFPRALGVQVSVLARNGLHQADLQLHPAELGPISVRIEMIGTQTNVSFTADLASTRQVIEAGLPELASALREQGLTLSGGGVFQQSPGHSEHGAHKADKTMNGSAESVAEPEEESTPQRVVVTVPDGGVDLYA